MQGEAEKSDRALTKLKAFGVTAGRSKADCAGAAQEGS